MVSRYHVASMFASSRTHGIMPALLFTVHPIAQPYSRAYTRRALHCRNAKWSPFRDVTAFIASEPRTKRSRHSRCKDPCQQVEPRTQANPNNVPLVRDTSEYTKLLFPKGGVGCGEHVRNGGCVFNLFICLIVMTSSLDSLWSAGSWSGCLVAAA